MAQIFPDPLQRTRLRIQVINRFIEKALDLARVQIHRDNMVAPCDLQHVGDELRRDGRARLVFLVLARVGEVRNYGGDAAGGRGFTRVDYYEEFHEAVVDVAWERRLEDEDCSRQLLVLRSRYSLSPFRLHVQETYHPRP